MNDIVNSHVSIVLCHAALNDMYIKKRRLKCNFNVHYRFWYRSICIVYEYLRSLEDGLKSLTHICCFLWSILSHAIIIFTYMSNIRQLKLIPKCNSYTQVSTDIAWIKNTLDVNSKSASMKKLTSWGESPQLCHYWLLNFGFLIVVHVLKEI